MPPSCLTAAVDYVPKPLHCGGHQGRIPLGSDDRNRAGLGDANKQGDANNDVLHGGAGSDTVKGGTGDDPICGGQGDDNDQGGDGNDTITDDPAERSGRPTSATRRGSAHPRSLVAPARAAGHRLLYPAVYAKAYLRPSMRPASLVAGTDRRAGFPRRGTSVRRPRTGLRYGCGFRGGAASGKVWVRRRLCPVE
jgi:RTX calcium-binding nonapeptide repeat (4 copies)